MRRFMFVHILLFVLSGTFLTGCGTSSNVRSPNGNKYRYVISLISPEVSSSLLYRDDRMIIQFRFDDPAIRFQVQNLSTSVMQIDFGVVELDVGGNVSTVRSLATLYDTTGVLQPRRAISPFGVVRDIILPTENVSIEGRSWVIRDLLPTTDGGDAERAGMVRSWEGNTIGLVLPVTFGLESRTYRFQFRVDSISQDSWSSVRRPAWLPPAPPVAGPAPGRFDYLTAAVIAGGFAGLIYYISTVKKSPAH